MVFYIARQTTHMKRQLFFAFVLSFALISCQKNTTTEPEFNPIEDLYAGGVPATKEEMEEIPTIDGSFLSSLGSLEKIAGDKYTLGMHAVGDQERTSACTPYATNYGMLSWFYTRIYKKQFIASPAFTFNRMNGGTNRGISIPRVLSNLKLYGACSMHLFDTHDTLEQPNGVAVADAEDQTIAQYVRFKTVNLDDIKKAIKLGFPLPFSMPLDEGFKGQWPQCFIMRNNVNVMTTNAGAPPKTHTFHTMLITGYNDDIQAFKVMNSWGKDCMGSGLWRVLLYGL